MENLLSVIIPVYNAENYLNECLNSLLKQTYKNIEIICVNDGSKDKSRDILDNFAQKDNRIKVLEQENQGPAAARNLGLKNVKGKFIMFCDADDTYEPSMCEQMVKTLISQNVDIVMCDCNINDKFNGTIRKSKELEYYRLKIKKYNNLTSDTIKQINCVICASIFKTELINKYNISFNEKCKYHEDEGFFLKYLSLCKTYFGLEKCLYNYNICNALSLMAKYKNAQNNLNIKYAFLYAFYDVLEFIVNNQSSIPGENIKGFEYRFVNQIRYCSSIMLTTDEKIEVISILREQLKNITLFDDNKFIKKKKKNNRKKALKFMKLREKYTLLEKIFSLKNESEYTKVITILGFKFRLQRKHRNTERSNLG